MDMLHTVAIALGSNLGDRTGNIRRAAALLSAAAGIEHLRCSETIETVPLRVGESDPGGMYANAAAVARTSLSPGQLLALLQSMERAVGRDRISQPHGAARVLDLDLLLYGETVMWTAELTLPHPAMCERDFVLGPLASVAPEMVIPTTGLTVAQQLARLQSGGAAEARTRILLIRPSALGDVCRSVAVAAELKALYPNSQLDWLVQDGFADAVRAHPAVDGLVLFRRGRLKDGLGAAVAVARALRAELRDGKYDVVVDAQGLLRSGLMAWATGAAVRIGPADAREFGWIGYNRSVRRSAVHTVARMLELLGPLREDRGGRGGKGGRVPWSMPGVLPETWRLRSVPEAAEWRGQQAWAARRYVVLAPTSRWIAKAWPVERFDALAARLLAAGACERIVVVGGPGEQAQCAPLLERAKADARVIDLVGRTTVGQLMATIEGSALVVANDSAAVHMAAGFGRPLVALYGPTDIEKVGPLFRGGDVVQVRRSTDMLMHKNAGGRAMMERIGIAVVEQMARARLTASGLG